jgi:hypothetical protein
VGEVSSEAINGALRAIVEAADTVKRPAKAKRWWRFMGRLTRARR